MRAALAAALVALAGSALAAKPTERTKQKAVAEKSRENIREKLDALKKEISRTEAQKEDVADELAESEQAISDANRSLRELSEETSATNQKVRDLDEQRAQLAATVDAQKRQLARLLKEHYVAGSEDRIKLLLSGDFYECIQFFIVENVLFDNGPFRTNGRASVNSQYRVEVAGHGISLIIGNGM